MKGKSVPTYQHAYLTLLKGYDFVWICCWQGFIHLMVKEGPLNQAIQRQKGFQRAYPMDFTLIYATQGKPSVPCYVFEEAESQLKALLKRLDPEVSFE